MTGNRTNHVSKEEDEFQILDGRNDSPQNMSRTSSPDPYATTTDAVNISTSGVKPYQVEIAFILGVTHVVLNGILMVMGLITNTLSFIVWLQPSTRKLTISPAVLILAIFDTIVLWNDSSYYWFSDVFGMPLPGPSTRCDIRNYVSHVTSCSVAWLLVVTTGSRLSAVWKPARQRSLHTRQTTAIVSVAIMLILSLINIPVLLTYDPITCQVVDSMTSYARYLLPIQFLLVHAVLPDGFLIIGNIFLVVLFRKHRLAFKRQWKISKEHRESSPAGSITTGVALLNMVHTKYEPIGLQTDSPDSPEYPTHHFVQLVPKPSTSTQLEAQSETPVEPFSYSKRVNCEVPRQNINAEYNHPNYLKTEKRDAKGDVGGKAEDGKSIGGWSERRLEGRHKNGDVTQNYGNTRGSQRMSIEEISGELESITDDETDKKEGIQNVSKGPFDEGHRVQHDHGGHRVKYNLKGEEDATDTVQYCDSMTVQDPQSNQKGKQSTFKSVKHHIRPSELTARVTKLAVAMSCIHLCLTAPYIIMFSYSNLHGAFLWGEIGFVFRWVHEYVLLLLYLNCTVNFFIYIAYIPPFKRELGRFGRKCCALLKKNSVYPSGQGIGA